MKQKEYGGYIELDEYSGEEYYPEAWALNSGRAALRLFIRLKKIRKIYLPAFCCDTVREACAAEGILWEYYSVDKDFRPCLSRRGIFCFRKNFMPVMFREEIQYGETKENPPCQAKNHCEL